MKLLEQIKTNKRAVEAMPEADRLRYEAEWRSVIDPNSMYRFAGGRDDRD